MVKGELNLEYKIGVTESQTAKNIADAMKKAGTKPNMSEVRKLAKDMHRNLKP